MKNYMLYFPVPVILLLTALWLHHTSSQNSALQAAIATQRAELFPASSTYRAAGVAENEARALMANNAALLSELRRIEAATSSTQNQTAALQKRIPPSLDTEIVESFGRILDMGAEFGQYCRLISSDFDEVQREMTRRGLNAEDLNDHLVKGFMKLATWAPEISAFEDTPSEIASLQSSALRETFALHDTQTQQAEAIIQAHFASMKTAGLTYSGHDSPDWRERRNEALTELLWKLRPLLPANSKQISNLTQIVNFGAGMEIRTLPPAPGMPEPQMMQSLPTWPAVPWLPAKPDQ